MGTYYGGGGSPGPVRVMCECIRRGVVSEAGQEAGAQSGVSPEAAEIGAHK